MTRPDSVFDYKPPRKYSADDLLDFLDDLTPESDRVLLLRTRTGAWEMRSTVNRLDGRLGVRAAISDLAHRLNYAPHRERGGYARRDVKPAVVVTLSLLGMLAIAVIAGCPPEFPADLRESGISSKSEIAPLDLDPPGRAQVRPLPPHVAERPEVPASPDGPAHREGRTTR